MDPVTAVVVSAIAAGAAAGVKDSATQAVKDAYAALKKLITGKYENVDVAAVERRPDSEAKRESLAEDLEDAGAGGDAQLAAAAVAVIAAVKQFAPDTGSVVGVDLEGVVAGALSVAGVESAGDGVRVVDSQFAGDIDIKQVKAGIPGPPDPTTARS